MTEQCSHYVDNKCKNGFPVTGPCAGIPGVPICLKEDVCAAVCNRDDGLPYGFPRKEPNAIITGRGDAL